MLGSSEIVVANATLQPGKVLSTDLILSHCQLESLVLARFITLKFDVYLTGRRVISCWQLVLAAVDVVGVGVSYSLLKIYLLKCTKILKLRILTW